MEAVGSRTSTTSADPKGLDPDSAEWLRALADGGRRVAAVERLHELLLRVARSEVRRRDTGQRITGPELDDVAFHAAADALLAIMDKLGQFRGESRFTTWVYKFVIFEVSTQLGRHFWRQPRAPMPVEDWHGLADRLGLQPSEQAEGRELFAALRRAVDTTLTERQRRVFVCLALDGLPLDALVAQLGTNRNAIYKTMFDARRKLRATLVAEGYLDPEAPRDR